MVEVRRDIGDVCAYLRADTARPSLGEEPEVIFKRRDPLYVECSQYQFNIAKGDADWKALTPPLPGLHRIGLSPSVPSIRHAGARGGGGGQWSRVRDPSTRRCTVAKEEGADARRR